MKVSSATAEPPQAWAAGAVGATTRANGERLAQHPAERAYNISTPQALSLDGAGMCMARRAKDFIDGHFREPVRMEDLCRATGIGARNLQRSFRQRYGVTFRSYLKAVRLDAAHRDLIAADPSEDTVTTIALSNGCNHLGRFASEFRARFGQLPKETLRSEPAAFGRPQGSTNSAC